MKVIHFYNGLGGGVQMLIAHLVNFNFNKDVNYEIVYVVEKLNEKKIQKIPHKNSVKEHFLIYESDWNFYYTIKKLRRILSEDAVLVAHDWLELGMISHLQLVNPVIAFLHGNYDYYYNLYQKHKTHVNLFLSVTESLVKKINKEESATKNSVIHYSIPIADFKFREKKYDKLKILFIANDLLDNNKNLSYLPIINRLVVEKGVKLEWHIVGHGGTQGDIIQRFETASSDVKYYGYVDNQQLVEVFSHVNLFLNCSNHEGLPLTLIESMKSGLIPIVNSWNGSAYELINDKKNGFIVLQNKPEAYANVICELNSDKSKLPEIAQNAFYVAHKRHSIENQIKEFEEILFRTKNSNLNRKPYKIYGSRLDHPLIPNFLTYTARKILKIIHG